MSYSKQEETTLHLQQEDVSNLLPQQKEDFLLARQQAQPTENTTTQPMNIRCHPSSYFSPINLHFSIVNDFLASLFFL